MSEVKNVKVQAIQNKSATLKCTMCKFNASVMESLEIHIKNTHEARVIKCDQCWFWVPSEHHLKIHKKYNHQTQVKSIVIKNSLNLIKGEAGGLSDSKSNPKRGQASNNCKTIINDKRDIQSNRSGFNYQLSKKESAKVDTKPGFNYQGIKKESNGHIVIKNTLNLIKGEAGSLSDNQSNPKRGQADTNCNLNLNDKRDKKSNIPGFNFQELKKIPQKKWTKNLKEVMKQETM